MTHAIRIVLAGLVLLFASTVLYVTAFHAPRAKGLDVGVVGPPTEAARVQSALDAADRGGFDVRRYDSEPEAHEALLDTTVNGVVAGDRVLVASALGVAPTQTVTKALQGVAPGAAVVDARPLPSGDRRGLASLFTVIGTVIPSMAFGAILTMLGRGLPARVRWSAVLVYAVAAGIVVAFDVDVVSGALEGDFGGTAVAAGLLALAVAAGAHGLGHLLGAPGLSVSSLLFVLVGLSSSGGAVGHEFEPGFYGAISQLLPPGAAVTFVRNVEYFDWAATLEPLLVLLAWAFGGFALGLLGERVRKAAPQEPVAA